MESNESAANWQRENSKLSLFAADDPLDFLERQRALRNQLIARLVQPLKWRANQCRLDLRRAGVVGDEVANGVIAFEQLENGPSPGEPGVQTPRASFLKRKSSLPPARPG